PLTHESDRYTISIQYLLVIAFFLILRLPPPTTLFPYTTLFRSMLAAKEAAKFTAAVDLFGPLDWYTMLRHSDPQLSQYLRSLLGDPEKDRKIYEDDSPIKYVQNIRAPLLVLQGDNDARVPKEETEQLVDILKKRGN